jgi:ABC-2 type transport system permease protein
MTSPTGAQLRAVAVVRWRLFVNSLRSVRGRLNLVSRAFAGLLVAATALGGATLMGSAAYGITAAGKLGWLAALLWAIFLFWQFFPVMATAFTQNIDTSAMLRFPLAYRTYFLVRLIFGSLDIATALGLFWSLGLAAGACAASPHLLPWALLAVACFVAFNLLLARTIFAWIEHWLSRRRSREVMGVIFLLMMVGFQFLGPALNRYSHQATPKRLQVIVKFVPLERALPPGLTAASLDAAQSGKTLTALAAAVGILAYAGASLLLLHLRLRRQYSGDDPDGGSARQQPSISTVAARPGWKLPFVPGAVSAVFEKELRYFSRSGPMLFTMVMPLVMILLLWGGRKSLLDQQSNFFFPIGAAYCLLVMTNVVYNSFGGDGGGIQCFLMAPVSFRQIIFGKNLAQVTVLIAEVLILLTGVTFIYHAPPLVFLAATFAWYLFAAPLNFSVANLLSVYAPKRIDYAVFGRQRASEATIVASLVVQAFAVGLGALAMFLGYQFSNMWLAALALAILAIPAIVGYLVLLYRVDRIVMSRREVLISELCRA